jgi:hypothetical protein
MRMRFSTFVLLLQITLHRFTYANNEAVSRPSARGDVNVVLVVRDGELVEEEVYSEDDDSTVEDETEKPTPKTTTRKLETKPFKTVSYEPPPQVNYSICFCYVFVLCRYLTVQICAGQLSNNRQHAATVEKIHVGKVGTQR